MLFLVLDFPLGAPNTLLKHVIEGSIWGDWLGRDPGEVGGSVLVIGFLILLDSFPDCGLWIDFSVACFKRV